jgi:hypothetical protein
MADKLERIFEYRVLLTKRDQGAALSEPDQARMRRLRDQLPALVPPLDDRDPYTLFPEPLLAELVDEAGFHLAHLCNAAADGFALTVEVPPPLGHRVAVRVRDPQHAFEYTFPGRVVSRVVRGQCAVSVAFEGEPSQAPLSTHASGVWHSERAGARRQRHSG